MNIHTFQLILQFLMKLVDRLRTKEINIKIANIFLSKIKRFLLPINFNNSNPFIHLFFSHFVIRLSSHHFFLFARHYIYFFVFVIYHTLNKLRNRQSLRILWSFFRYRCWLSQTCEQIINIKLAHPLVFLCNIL